jgi:N-acyl-phosphatidylethanolamine-hydrolysing phospholipase D
VAAFVGLTVLLGSAVVDHVRLGAEAPASVGAAHHLRRGFQNDDPQSAYPLIIRARHLIYRAVVGWPPRGRPLAIVPNDGAILRANGSEPTVTWVGHATFLIQLDGMNILTDPHWGGSVGPLRVAGMRRLVPPGIPFDDLPHIDAVVISHDHWDHLDAATVKRLAQRDAPRFFVPLGIKAWLSGLGVDHVVELDWWQSESLGRVTFALTPAQHSSGRAFTDQNRRLWGSWVLTDGQKRLFFAGDTGYHHEFGEIARRWGPFDIAALPIGGYSAFERHHPGHLNPEESVQAFEDLGARLLVPMHWGTFETNHEPFREPPDRLMREALRRGIEEHVAILSPGQTIHW